MTTAVVNYDRIVKKFIDHSLTLYDVEKIAHDLKVYFSRGDDVDKKKRIVVKHVLLQLLTEEPNNLHYQELLEETDGWLGLKKLAGYSCSITGCSFRGERHRDYLRHLKNNHFICQSLSCNFGKTCKQRFSSIEELEIHVQRNHLSKKKGVTQEESGSNVTSGLDFPRQLKNRELTLSVPCRCILGNCGNQSFPNVKLLMHHYNSSIHKNDRRPCIFKGCRKIFDPGYVSRSHFYNQHRQEGQRLLKVEFTLQDNYIVHDNTMNLVHDPGLSVKEWANTDVHCVQDDDLQLHEEASDLYNCNDNEGDLSDDFMKSYADFLNRMANVKMIPQTTLQLITKEFLELSILAQKCRITSVSNILNERQLSHEVVTEVIKVLEKDIVIEAIRSLDSPYKREQFVEQNFVHNPPEERILNLEAFKEGRESKDSFMFISPLKGVQLLFEDETFLAALDKNKRSRGLVSSDDDEVIEEITDGQIVQNLPYRLRYPCSYVGLLYSDGVEITSPLAAGKGRHKILQMFWTIADLPKRFRSQVDQIQICIIVRDQILKKYGYAEIYKPLLQELKLLENGIIVEKPFRRKIRVCFPFHLGDNLESHSLGGFSVCFSSKDICRTCHIQYNELGSKIHDHTSAGPHDYWTMEEYDRIVLNLEPDTGANTELELVTDENLFTEIDEPHEDEASVMFVVEDNQESDTDSVDDEAIDSESNFGLRYGCILSSLESFHPVYSFPHDVLHDVLEGMFRLTLKLLS